MSRKPTFLRDQLAALAKTENKAVELLDAYDNVSGYLAVNVLPYVTTGAAASNGGSLLTDHGVDHVDRVTELAGKIIDTGSPNPPLSAEELYLLLCAIQFHDLANINGREQHEQRIIGHIEQSKQRLFNDSMLTQAINQVAKAHSGVAPDGTKNTIGAMAPSNTLRKHFLAAVLRLADEISDDENRVSDALLQGGSVPPDNLIYHVYAYHLVKVTVEPACITYRFHLTDEVLTNTFLYRDKRSDILAYIFERIQKTEIERQYCQRFMGHLCPITNFTIELLHTPKSKFDDERNSITLHLTDTVYPGADTPDIWHTCRQLMDKDVPALFRELTG